VEEHPLVDEPQEVEKVQEDDDEGVGYLGGPYDISLLSTYSNHVVFVLLQMIVSIVVQVCYCLNDVFIIYMI